MNDKLDRLMEALEHPERFSDAEINQLLDDDETRRLYNIMCSTAEAETEPIHPDIDLEWASFVAKNMAGQSKRTIWKRMATQRRAAIIAAGLLVSAVATALILHRKTDFTTKQHAEIEAIQQSDILPQDATELPPAPTAEPTVIIFNGDPLENIVNTVCTFYGVSATFSNDSTKELRLYFRWNQAESLDDVIAQLNNFQQISISLSDNALTVE